MEEVTQLTAAVLTFGGSFMVGVVTKVLLYRRRNTHWLRPY